MERCIREKREEIKRDENKTNIREKKTEGRKGERIKENGIERNRVKEGEWKGRNKISWKNGEREKGSSLYISESIILSFTDLVSSSLSHPSSPLPSPPFSSPLCCHFSNFLLVSVSAHLGTWCFSFVCRVLFLNFPFIVRQQGKLGMFFCSPACCCCSTVDDSHNSKATYKLVL